MPKPKKVQKPAYVVVSPEKGAEEASSSENPQQPQMKSLLGEAPNATMRQSEQHRSPAKKPGQGSFGRETVRERQARFKPSPGPTQSLMSIDFSSRVAASPVSAATAPGSRNEAKPSRPHSSHSSDEESRTDCRSDWKNGRRNQSHRESANRREDLLPMNHGSGWRAPSQQSSHAPLIVDMGNYKPSSDSRSSNQPQSLLGDYWTSVAQKPTSLMDFKAKDSMGHYTVPNERHRQQDYFPPSSNQQRNSGPGSRRDDPLSSRKRAHGSNSGSEVPEKKPLRNEIKNRLFTCKGKGHTFVLIPASCSTTFLHGRARMTVLKGNVTVLAHKLQEGTQYDVFSPTSGSLLALACEDGHKLKADQVREVLAKFGIPENDKELEALGDTTVAVLMLDKLESTVCDYITSFIPYTQLFTAPLTREKVSHSVRGVTLPKLGLKIAPLKEMGPMCLNMSQDYEDVLGRFAGSLSKEGADVNPPKWLCCGAKNSGKSTFSRMLINTALKSVDTVGYLDCDVGQTEFSPPGTLSFHVIKKPILGQPFCHQRQAERMVFYGDIAAGQDPSMYVKCLKYVFEAYREMKVKPALIVNTMGFPEGIGLMLLIDTVQIVQPDMVVQIESHNQAANFPAITHELVALDEGWTCNKSPVVDPKSKMEETHAHELILLPTLLNLRRDFSLKLKPVDLRNLSLLSSLSLGLESGLTLTSLTPFAVPFRQLAMHVCHHRLSGPDVLAAVDASVVSLCVADISQTTREEDSMPLLFDEMPVCECIGLGMIRAVDVNRGLLYIVTTLPRASLWRINTVLKGSVSLPDQIILKQKNPGHGPLPYVDALAPSTGVSAVRQRARMPRVTLGGNSNNT